MGMDNKVKIELLSFGFKYGAPESNFFFDVTFLPNPARLSGKNLYDDLDSEMYDIVAQNEAAQELISAIVKIIQIISRFDHCKIGIGCNSGRHRSVIVTKEISKRLENLGILHKVFHRDLI